MSYQLLPVTSDIKQLCGELAALTNGSNATTSSASLCALQPILVLDDRKQTSTEDEELDIQTETDSHGVTRVGMISDRLYQSASTEFRPPLQLHRLSRVDRLVESVSGSLLRSVTNGFATTVVSFGLRDTGKSSLLLQGVATPSIVEAVLRRLCLDIEAHSKAGQQVLAMAAADVTSVTVTDMLTVDGTKGRAGARAIHSLADLTLVQIDTIEEATAVLGQVNRGKVRTGCPVQCSATIIRLVVFKDGLMTTMDFFDLPGSYDEFEQLERSQYSVSWTPDEISAKKIISGFARAMVQLSHAERQGGREDGRLSATVPSIRDSPLSRLVVPSIITSATTLLAHGSTDPASYPALRWAGQLAARCGTVEAPVLRVGLTVAEFIEAGGELVNVQTVLDAMSLAATYTSDAGPDTAGLARSRLGSSAGPARSLRAPRSSAYRPESEAGSFFGGSGGPGVGPGVGESTVYRTIGGPGMGTNGYQLGDDDMPPSLDGSRKGATQTQPMGQTGRQSIKYTEDRLPPSPRPETTNEEPAPLTTAALATPAAQAAEIERLTIELARRDADLARLTARSRERAVRRRQAGPVESVETRREKGFVNDPKPPSSARNVTGMLRRDVSRKEEALAAAQAQIATLRDDLKLFDGVKARLRRTERVAAERQRYIEQQQAEIESLRGMLKATQTGLRASESEVAALTLEVDRVRGDVGRVKDECGLMRAQSRLDDAPPPAPTPKVAPVPERPGASQLWKRRELLELDDAHQSLREKLAKFKG